MKICLMCDKKFLPSSQNKIYCSPKCNQKAYRNRHKNEVNYKQLINNNQKHLRDKKLIEYIESSKKQKRDIGFPKNISYQKPFYEVKDGYGYEGVILCDKKTGEVQCHVCGAWFHWLQNHIRGTHKMKAEDYRIKFKLGWRTALCSEKVREDLVKRSMTYPWERMKKRGEYLANLSKNGISHNKKWRERNKVTLEEKNKFGTCTLQLYDQMERKSQELGRQPYAKEMIGDRGTNLRQSIIKTYGSVKEMRRLLEMNGYFYISNHKENYTTEELLENLRKFTNIYKRKPSYSDCKRGILPSSTTYEKRFGSFSKAKMLAFSQI